MKTTTPNRVVTLPQDGERTSQGVKLPRSERHKALKSVTAMVGDTSKPWTCKLKKVV